MAVKHFKGLRNSTIDGDNSANQLSLGVPRAVVQQCQVRGVVLRDSFTTAFGQRVIVEHYPQKCSHNMYGKFV